MTWDLATAKTRLNIVGTAQDVQLQSALDAALAIAESYCKRKFSYASEVASYYHHEGAWLFVPRYPIDTVASVVNTGAPNITIKYKVNRSAGVIDLHGRYVADQIDVTYSGGYRTFPDDLELALWGIFDGVWNSMQTAGTNVSGGIDKISLVGVGSISYAGGGAGHTGAGDYAGPYIAILDNYVRHMT